MKTTLESKYKSIKNEDLTPQRAIISKNKIIQSDLLQYFPNKHMHQNNRPD
jgi:hypothetical protein